MREHYTIKVDLETYEKMKEYYLPFKVEEGGEYIAFIAEVEGVKITIYNSNKATYRKVTFMGEFADKEALKWVETLPEKPTKKVKVPTKWVDLNEQVGSDEVGVGDFLLPMIVVAIHIRRSQIRRLKALGIDDSKKMDDAKIREVGPIVIKEFDYSLLNLSNEKYNEMIDKGLNINSLKAKMHNRALKNMVIRSNKNAPIYVDQFCSVNKYFSYLGLEDEPVVTNITFQTKGESYYPSVALASVIARYKFLLELDKLSEELGMEIPKGAGVKVDEVAKILLDKLGKEEIDKLVKKDFKNYERLFK